MYRMTFASMLSHRISLLIRAYSLGDTWIVAFYVVIVSQTTDLSIWNQIYIVS